MIEILPWNNVEVAFSKIETDVSAISFKLTFIPSKLTESKPLDFMSRSRSSNFGYLLFWGGIANFWPSIQGRVDVTVFFLSILDNGE